MRTIIETIPHNEQRYDTCGDWLFNEKGDLHIKVSDMSSEDFNFFVGLHEMIEAYFCKVEGIKEEDVTAFDKHFEDMRVAFPDLVGEMEPGDHENAPYNKQHLIASRIERWVFDQRYGESSNQMWEEYTKAVNNL